MSKKNIRYVVKKGNQYPFPDRMVLYSRKKKVKPIPEVGKKYHCFDDGKIRPSRHYIIQVDEVLGYMQFKKKYPEKFQLYIKQAKDHYWLYSRHSDKFIITYKGENGEIGIYTRTKQGGWFGIGDLFDCGYLDVTGKLWNNLVQNMINFNYSKEEKEKFIKENTI